MQEGHSGIRQFSSIIIAHTVFAEVCDKLLRMVHAEHFPKVGHFIINFNDFNKQNVFLINVFH
jgi:hypothetical protein